jgi:hypothetical protein
MITTPGGTAKVGRFRKQKAPGSPGPLFLVVIVNDGFASGPIVMVFLDDGGTFGRLSFFDYSRAVPIPVPVVIPMACANGYTRTSRADANAYADFFSQYRG